MKEPDRWPGLIAELDRRLGRFPEYTMVQVVPVAGSRMRPAAAPNSSPPEPPLPPSGFCTSPPRPSKTPSTLTLIPAASGRLTCAANERPR